MRLFMVLCGLGLTAEFTAAQPVYQLVQETCPPHWSSFNGRCFKYVATSMTWADAELHCVSQGANLASIHSEEEHNFVRTLIKETDTEQKWTWIGLTDLHKSRTWMWSDGSAVDYLNFHAGEPNNDHGPENCVNTNFENTKQWNDLRCSASYSFVCATRKAC